jgi:YYY domain-containing protein
MYEALRVFALIEVLGLAAAPLAAVVFARLPGAGMGFAKPLGLLLVTWLVWMGASLHLVPYGLPSAIGACVLLVLAGGAAWIWWRPRTPDPLRLRGFYWAEALGVVAFAGMALLVAYSPDVWNTEKPMDMAFVNAADNARFFPPADPWMAGEDLNYYYLGHLMAALMVRLTGVEPSVGYNLAVAGFFALSVAAAFTVAFSLWGAVSSAGRGAVAAGLWAVALCLVLGTIGGGERLLRLDGPLRGYDWFAASRVIAGTINEFPSFSFVLADLHAHVMAIPFSLLALAIALQLAIAGPPQPPRGRAALELCAGAIAIGSLYAINAWSFPVLAGLVALGALVRMRDQIGLRERARTAAWLLVLLVLAVIAVLPFLVSYDPAADGFARVTEHASFSRFTRDEGRIYGLLAYLVATAYAVRVARSRHPWRNAAWTAVAAVFAGSLLAGADLAGVAGLLALVAVAAHAMLASRLAASERFAWLLIAGGVLCLLIPEVVYVRDSFAGSDLYRMNTVFKLGFQAWLLLAIGGAAVLLWTREWLPRGLRMLWALPLLVGLALSLAFPIAGSYARKDGFAHSPHLDGLRWLAATAPGDVAAIAWLRERAPRASVVLESVGEDYSAFGHARISTFTGLPTVLGWPGHEVQWDHDPGTRREDVERLYTLTDAAAARELLSRYRVRYVVVGPLERADYGDAGVAKWDTLGRRVFDREGTSVWELTSARA